MRDRLLTGSRIRDRRMDLGQRQAELAAAVGISASYLNLIEHNRRRIAGKLLHDIARVLQVEPAMLQEGAEGNRVAALRVAAAAEGLSGAEADRAEDLAGRFPGWAGLVEAQSRKITRLEGRVAELSDRLSHDPALARSLHEVLTAVTGIHSAAAILVEAGDLDRDWQNRFFRNIHADSSKLREASRALVQYLDAPEVAQPAQLDPTGEAEGWLAQAGFHIPALETGTATVDSVVDGAGLSVAGSWVLRRWLSEYRADAVAMPLGRFSAVAHTAGWDPARIAKSIVSGGLIAAGQSPEGRSADRSTGGGAVTSLAAVMRRLASLPPAPGQPPMGLAVTDGAGAMLYLKPEAGFALPRGGGACPLWPVFAALGQPGRPIRRRVALPGDPGVVYLTHAVAEVVAATDWDAPPQVRATMLVTRTDAGEGGLAAVPVGQSCRVCPRVGCTARREPSVIARDESLMRTSATPL